MTNLLPRMDGWMPVYAAKARRLAGHRRKA
jgi:hypothetical protein